MATTESSKSTILTIDHILMTLSTWTGIPVARLTSARLSFNDFEKLVQALNKSLYGQRSAISTAVAALQHRFQLPQRQEERRPLWSALFAGTSGVGKTQLARELATHFFNDAKAIIKIDLSEFHEPHTIARLVGAPPGYKGHGDGGELTNALRRCRSGVLLLDEVEKAHPDILTTVVLPLLGEGTVHDMNDGKILDASNMIVVLTTNLGTSHSPERTVGFATEEQGSAVSIQAAIHTAISAHFPREVLGRIDDIIIFSQLSDSAIREIWHLEERIFEERLATQDLGLRLSIDSMAEDLFIKQIKNRIAHEGARAIRRYFERAIIDRCLELLQEGIYGFTTIRIEIIDGCIRYKLTNDEPIYQATT